MDIKNIAIPEIYKQSADFRFFCKWFETALDKIKFDTENFFDLYDPLRCPENLLWLLADTMGYKFDDRLNLPTSFNRLVLLYFMSMIYNRGSKDGVTLAAEVNLKQFDIHNKIYGYTNEKGEKVEGKEILSNRLEDTSIPVNSVSVTPHTPEGYIDVVYFSDKIPKDACIEYVRPLGMFLFPYAGVRFDTRTKIAIDARLTDARDENPCLNVSFGPTHVGHYRREDYARLQKTAEIESQIEGRNLAINDAEHKRHSVWYRNSEFEDNEHGNGFYESGAGKAITPAPNPGYRALYSLQLSNNEEIVRSLVEPIFSLGFEPQSVGVFFNDNYLKNPPVTDDLNEKAWNLRYDRKLDEEQTAYNLSGEYDVSVVDSDSDNNLKPKPAVNPIMAAMGDSISLDNENTKYTETNKDSGKITNVDVFKDKNE